MYVLLKSVIEMLFVSLWLPQLDCVRNLLLLLVLMNLSDIVRTLVRNTHAANNRRKQNSFKCALEYINLFPDYKFSNDLQCT